MPALNEGLIQISITRPKDPLLQLAQILLNKSPNKNEWVLCPRADIEALYFKHSDKNAIAIGSGVKAARALAKGNNDVQEGSEEGRVCQDEDEEELESESPFPPMEQMEHGLERDLVVEIQTSDLEQSSSEIVNEDVEDEQPILDEDMEEQPPPKEQDQKLDEETQKLAAKESQLEMSDATDEAEEDCSQDKPIVVRHVLRRGSQYLLLRLTIFEAEGRFLVDGRDQGSLERYEFECQGVNFPLLRQGAPTNEELVEVSPSLLFQTNRNTPTF